MRSFGFRLKFGLTLAALLSACGGEEGDTTPTSTPAAERVEVGPFNQDPQGMSSDPARPHGAVAGDFLGRLEGNSLGEDDDDPSLITASVCPGSTTLPGIDVSYYQGTINWSQVKASGVKFAVIRVSDGTTFLDPKFSTNWTNAKAAGVVVGAYQFFRPSQDPTAQADLVVTQLQAAGFTKSDIPPVIDVEVTEGMSSSTIISRVNTWLARIQSKLGRTPLLYTSPGFWSGLGNPTPSPLPYLWVAHWTSNCPTIPPNWTTWKFWQYSATGTVPGISTDVDMDTFNGGILSIKRL